MEWFNDSESAKNNTNVTTSVSNEQSVFQVPVSNRFGLLINEELPVTKPAGNPSVSQPKKEKMPPIIVTHKIQNFKQFNAEVKSIISDYSIRYLKNSVNIYTSNKGDFTKLINEFRNSKVGHYTFSTKDEKQKKIVMKAAPDMDIEEVKKTMTENHFPINECKQLLNKAGQPSQSYLIYTDVSTNLRDLKQVRKIGNVQAKWENYARKSSITQCRRCQSFGHGTKNCGNPPRCVKCISPHLTKDCDLIKTDDSVPQCCNCHGPHTANYRGCPSRPQTGNAGKASTNSKGKENLIGTNLQIINPPNNNQDFPPLKNKATNPPKPTNTNNSISYASVTNNAMIKHKQPNYNPNNGNNNNNNTNFNDFQKLIKELNELNQLCNIKNMIKMVQSIKTQLTNCSTPLDKLLVFQTLAEQYE